MFRVFRTLGLALGLLGGFIAAQGPEFAQQYAQRLGGALDELRRQIEMLDSDAKATGLDRDAAIEHLRQNADALVARRGAAVRNDVERFKALDDQKKAIDSTTSPLGRLYAVSRQPDLPIARATYKDYTPAVPTTTDGLIAGILGFFAAWGLWRVIADLGRGAGRRIRRPRPETRAV